MPIPPRLLLAAMLACSSALAAAQSATESATESATNYQRAGVANNMPIFEPALKARMTFPMAWSPQVKDLAAWRAAGRAKVWEATLQEPDNTPFQPQVIAEVDRGSYVAKQVVFNLTRDSRVRALMLVPKGKGPFPATLMLHDHGGKFDIGKEKAIQTWNEPEKLASAQAWADKHFSGRYPGDEMARRGYVVLATDALGWGERGPLTGEAQQALAANSFNLGTSLAGLMALEDARAARFLATQPQVDPKRVAAIGFSMGAYRAWQVAALSDDITAFVAANWMATLHGLMVPGNNQLRGDSGWNFLHPGLARHLDYPDIASLAAPKPAMFLNGEEDRLFPAQAARDAHAKMRKVWQAFGAADRYQARMLPGGHVFPADVQDAAYDWLDRHFQHRPPAK